MTKDNACEYRQGVTGDQDPIKHCQIASNISGSVCKVSDSLCNSCLSMTSPKTELSPIVQLMVDSAKKEGQIISETEESDELIGHGPGTQLKKMIPEFLESPSCSCRDFAKKMNIWGPDLCEERRERIVDRLVKESKKRPMFGWVPSSMTRMVADRMLTSAINRARLDIDSVAKDWFVAVTTAPRPEPTVRTCLDSLTIAGFRPHVFAEPGSEPLGNAYSDRMIVNQERLGVWRNWVNSVRYALENSDSEIIMTVQDDCIFHPDSRTFTESFLWPSTDVGFVSLYTPRKYTIRPRYKTSKRAKGINKVVTKSLWGACALVFPRKVAEEMMQHKLIETWAGASIRTKSAWPKKRAERLANPWMIQNSDTAIGKIMNSMKKSMHFVDPSPVNHFATTSACGHGGNGGNRNCLRCAKFSQPLADQVPLQRNGKPFSKVSYDQLGENKE